MHMPSSISKFLWLQVFPSKYICAIIYSLAMSHIKMSRVTHRNESRRTWECVIAHTFFHQEQTHRIPMFDMAYFNVWRPYPCREYDAIIFLSYFICDILHSYVWDDSFTCVTWLIYMCDITQFVCVTWPIHMCDMTHHLVYQSWLSC